ncbi:MAG TPA: hypothetical protein GX505_02200 [Clostridiales bacterium]|nr:hypothetical protein [Clostridiales bacterium]
MSLFTYDIYDWSSWSRVYQSIDAWQPLIKHIFQKERLPFMPAEHLTPGTNAVFKVGNYVIKIFAPAESGINCAIDIQTETFAMKRAEALGIPAPKCIACGFIEDKYCFSYLIMEYIRGREFTNIADAVSYLLKCCARS